MTESNSELLVEQAITYGDNVLKRLVAHTVGKPVDELFDSCIDTRGALLIDDGSKNKYTLSLDIVDKDYMLDLKHFQGNADVQSRMVFLLNAVKILYCPIKDHMKKWAAENDTTFHNVLQIGINTTLFLNKDTEKRIGIILTSIDA